MGVLAEEFEVSPRLEQLGLSKAGLLEVIKAAVGANRATSALAPRTTRGQNTYSEGVVAMRQTFLGPQWRMSSVNNIETIYNESLGIRVGFQNASRAGDPLSDPIAKTKKGEGMAREIAISQRYLFEEFNQEQLRASAESLSRYWVLFVSISGDDIRAELSNPQAIKNNQFCGFHERIILLAKGDWEALNPTVDLDQGGDEYEVPISRKG